MAAWTLHDTQGEVKSVSVVGDDVYLLINRNGTYVIEQFDDDLNLDSALTGEVGTPTQNWSGLDHLDGQSVSVVADGVAQNDQIVSGGTIVLDNPASHIEVGLPYTHIIEPLPPTASGEGGFGYRLRLVEAIFRLQKTQSLSLDTGRGLKDIPLREIGQTPILNAPPPAVSGDIPVRALGWQKSGEDALWRIEQSLPYPFTLLSVTAEIKIND